MSDKKQPKEKHTKYTVRVRTCDWMGIPNGWKTYSEHKTLKDAEFTFDHLRLIKRCNEVKIVKEERTRIKRWDFIFGLEEYEQ